MGSRPGTISTMMDFLICLFTETPTMNALEFAILIFLVISPQIGRAEDPLDAWTWRSPLPPRIPLNAVTYGNGQFVAVGYNNAGSAPILASADAVTWLQRHSGTAEALY